MKNWRKILVTGMVAGMVAVTGCSSNLPETNQGNRNGQRVVDAVNRRTDTYSTTRARTRDGGVRTGFNRGLRRARHTGHLGTRHYNHVAIPGAVSGTGVSGTTRHHGVRTNRNISGTGHSTFNRGRVGHTFGYDGYSHTGTVDQEYGGYDLGVRTGNRNTTNINDRVVRSTPARNTANTAAQSHTVKPAANKTTRSTAPAKKAVQPTRKAAHGTTRSTTHQSPKPAKHVATPLPTAQPRMHNVQNPGTVTRNTPVRQTTSRQTQRNLTQRTDSTRNLNQVNNNNYSTWATPENYANLNTPFTNMNRGITPGTARNATRGITRGTNRSAANRGANRSDRRAARRNTNVANRRNVTQRNGGAYRSYGHPTRGLNQSRINAAQQNMGIYGSNYYEVNMYDGNNAYDYTNPAGLYGAYDGLNQAVPASASDDDGNDFAFFKRNKTENNDETPVTPVPGDGAQQVPTRKMGAPATPASPAPTSSDDSAYDDATDNIHDIDEAVDYNHNNHNHNGSNNTDIKPANPVNPVPAPPAPQRTGQRLMK